MSKAIRLIMASLFELLLCPLFRSLLPCMLAPFSSHTKAQSLTTISSFPLFLSPFSALHTAPTKSDV